MINVPVMVCPECTEILESGYVSYGSGLVWHEAALHSWRRLFFYALATGQPIIGSWRSSGLMSSRRALKCPACGTIVLPRVVGKRRGSIE
jgi:hypothetical protein